MENLYDHTASHNNQTPVIELYRAAKPSNTTAKKILELAQLSAEIANDPELTKECMSIVGHDVTRAALHLGQVLRAEQHSDLAPGSRISSALEEDLSAVFALPGQPVQVKNTLLPWSNPPPILDPALAEVPFIHRSHVDNQRAPTADGSYERLEFLGDAYIELMASRLLYPRFPEYPPGRLSQLRELLVKNETLAEFSLAYKFDERAEFPVSHKERKGDRSKLWNKTLGDMFEAYVAAVILSDPENGFATVEAWLGALWTPKLLSGPSYSPPENTLAKQDLTTKIVSRGTKIDYREEAKVDVKKEGKSWYTVGVYFTGWQWKDQHLGSAKALSKGEAGTRAAMAALLNPITAQIGAVKRDHDAKAKLEQAKLERAQQDAEPSIDKPQ